MKRIAIMDAPVWVLVLTMLFMVVLLVANIEALAAYFVLGYSAASIFNAFRNDNKE